MLETGPGPTNVASDSDSRARVEVFLQSLHDRVATIHVSESVRRANDEIPALKRQDIATISVIRLAISRVTSPGPARSATMGGVSCAGP